MGCYDDIVIKEIAVAVVRQAIKDWRYLCKSGKQTKDCNFKELEHFFEHDCAKYLIHDGAAERIYGMLKTERQGKERRWARTNSHSIRK